MKKKKEETVGWENKYIFTAVEGLEMNLSSAGTRTSIKAAIYVDCCFGFNK